MQKYYRITLTILLGLAAFTATNCGNTQAVFSEQAYQQAVSLKVESLALMDNATDDYSMHQSEIDRLNQELQKAYQYALGRPNNDTTISQWEILLDPQRNLLGGFLARWENEGSMSELFIGENKQIISDAFDTIIELESGKRKPSDVE